MILAVITADIVHSTRLAGKQAAELRRGLEGIFAGAPLEFFRGDSFQVLQPEPADALRGVLRARTSARSLGLDFDIRCSIGIGDGDPAAQPLATASGAAFLLSGRAFDGLGERRLAIVSEQEAANRAFRLLAAYADHLFGALTARQASIVHELLSGKTQIETAAQLGVTQPTISSHAQSAGWTEIEFLLTEYEALCASLKK